MFGLGPVEIMLIGAIAVMLYGKRLPEVGRSVGQSIGELRKQMATLSRDMDFSAHLDAAPGKRVTRRFDDERYVHTVEVTGSNPVPPTRSKDLGQSGTGVVFGGGRRKFAPAPDFPPRSTTAGRCA